LIDFAGDENAPLMRFEGSGVANFCEGVSKRCFVGECFWDIVSLLGVGVALANVGIMFCGAVPVSRSGERRGVLVGVCLTGLGLLDMACLAVASRRNGVPFVPSLVGLGVLLLCVLPPGVPFFFGVTLLMGNSHEK
jgi:hypothetical protein